VHNSLLHLLIENCTFLNIDISQSSVTTLQQRKAVAAKQQNAVHDQQSVSH